MKASRFGFIASCVILCGVTFAGSAADIRYPAKAVRMLVPFSPGSQTDFFARVMSAKLGEALGQQFVVDNRPSAGGTVATSVVAHATPDGHTLMLVSTGHAINATLYRNPGYKTLEDFAMISQVASVPDVLVVAPALNARNVRELIAAAKKSGKFNYGSAGIGSGTHINAEMFNLAAGIEAAHVPYRGTPEALTDTISGRVQFFFSPITPAIAQIRDGRLLALAVTTAQRSPVFPDVPTIAEAGMPGAEFEQWYGLMAPHKTPHAVIDLLMKETHRILDQPDIRKQFLVQGATARPSTPKEFDAFIREQVKKVGVVIKASGARAD
jgi:tripartite-type tricarboxylate transporter receptor subunit TctC